MSRSPKLIQAELLQVVNQALVHREALAELEKRRLALIAEARSFSSSITSSSIVGAPGVIQGPPPVKVDKND